MRKPLRYNFRSNKIPQPPDKNGKFKYNSFYKYDFVLKNTSRENFYDLKFNIKFNNRARVIKTIPSNLTIIIDLEENIATITIPFIENKQFINIDFFIENMNINNKIEITCVRIKRSKKLAVKTFINKKKEVKGNRFKKKRLSRIIKSVFSNIYISGIIIGITVVVIGYFIINSINGSKIKHENLDSLKTNKKNKILPQVSVPVSDTTLLPSLTDTVTGS